MCNTSLCPNSEYYPGNSDKENQEMIERGVAVSCKDMAIGAVFQIYKKIIGKDEECLNEGEEGL